MEGMVLLTEKTPSGWSGPVLFSQVGRATPGTGAATQPQSWSDFGFPASSPGRPGACGWVREASHLFSVQGTIWQTQPCCSHWHWGQWGLPSAANQCGGGYEYADRGQSWLAAPLPSPTPTPSQMSRKASSERTFLKCHLFCPCLRIHGAPWYFENELPSFAHYTGLQQGAPDLGFQILQRVSSKVNIFLLTPHASWGYGNQASTKNTASRLCRKALQLLPPAEVWTLLGRLFAGPKAPFFGRTHWPNHFPPTSLEF